MQRILEQELERVRGMLMAMSGRVERMIAKVNRALLERRSELAEEVIEEDAEVDRMEMAIDEECLTLLALHEPKAVDFRFLIAVSKIINELERMGDSSVNIAQGVIRLNDEPPLKPYIDLPRMSEIVRHMVRDSLDALVRKDAALARAVCSRDDDVDNLYHQLFRELVTYMIEEPKNVTRGLQLLLLARNLERIADHATNIAEDVIYFLEARDVRHSGRRIAETQ